MPEEKRNIYFWIFAAVVLFIFLSFLGPCTSGVLAPMPYRSLCPFSGKVVDADTKEPIEGAAVLGVYYYASIQLRDLICI